MTRLSIDARAIMSGTTATPFNSLTSFFVDLLLPAFMLGGFGAIGVDLLDGSEHEYEGLATIGAFISVFAAVVWLFSNVADDWRGYAD